MNEKRKRFHTLKSGKRQERVNLITAYCNGKLFAPFTVEGASNRNVFEIWLESCLLPSLKPGQIVIADNATFHRRDRIQELIETAGCQLKYLPPDSPDLNNIERCWSWLKSRIRQQIVHFHCIRDAMEYLLRTAS
ncbi:transposase [Nostoc sp.]|uniref:transposase n=1 Tax=Nostoc sp. TaxID=1180 RepID=UPI002FF9954B